MRSAVTLATYLQRRNQWLLFLRDFNSHQKRRRSRIDRRPATTNIGAKTLVPSQGVTDMADVDPKGAIFVGKSFKPELLTLALANRHGLVTGATRTGKTVTLQVLAEGFSHAG